MNVGATAAPFCPPMTVETVRRSKRFSGSVSRKRTIERIRPIVAGQSDKKRPKSAFAAE